MPRQARVEAVVDAAARLFSTNGFSATSVREVADGAAMTKAGLYYHFPEKEDLLYRICEHAISGVLAGARQALACEADPTARLACLLRNHIDYFFRHPHYLTVLNREHKTLSAEPRAQIFALERDYLDLVRGVIRDGQAAGCLRPVDPTVGAFAMLTVMNNLYDWYDADGRVAPEELVGQISTILLDGLGAGTEGEAT